MRLISILIAFCLVVNSKCLNVTFCNNLVPGISRLGQGIDLSLLDIYHDYTVDNIDGYAMSVIDFTCNENKTWISPFDEKTYQVPDQINAVIPLPSGIVYSEAHMEIDVEEVKKRMSLEVGIDFSLFHGMFSASLSYKESQYTLTNTSSFVAQTKAFVSTTEIDFIPAPFLNLSVSKFARYFYDQLPDKYEDNPKAFMEFFINYGTHYFERGNFGGTLSSWFEIQKLLRKTMSDKEISVNVEASFLGILKAHGAYDGEVAKVSEQFIENSKHSERYFGGIANLFESEGYKKWWPTVAGNPWLYSGQLKPISDLFPAGSKRDSLIKASQIYLDRNYLIELQRVLYSFLGKGYIGEDKAIVFEKNVQLELSMPIPDHEMIRELGQNISNYIFTPQWFMQQTRLCAIWGYDGFPCGKTQSCNVVGLKTAPIEHFEDVGNTICFDPCDFQVNGDNLPNWFNMTINSTQESWHATSSCVEDFFHYKLNVPDSSPGWLLNVQLCVYFNSNPTCVPPNTVTPHFRGIHCYGQEGGNSMSFEIRPIYF